jgi:hypothetical protein
VFFNACVVFAQIGLLIKIVHLLYYLTPSVSSFLVEVIPRTTGNGYRNMPIVLFEKECPVVVCLQTHAAQYLFVNEQRVIISIIIHIITVLFVLHWRG